MSGLMPPNPLSYEGQVVVPYINRDFDPTSSNYQFNVPTIWVNTSSSKPFILVSKPQNVADWIPFGEPSSGGILSVTVNSGAYNPVLPDSHGNINYLGDTTTITVVANANNTATISVVAPLIPAAGGTGAVSPTAHTLPVAEGSSAFNFLGPLTNGQLLIGSTGLDPVAATLTAGAGISILNVAGGITISNTGASFTWNNITTGAATLVKENGYFANSASLTTFTLPTTASSTFGDTITIIGWGTGGWKIAQNASQQIILGVSSTTPGITGYLASTNQYDQVELIYSPTTNLWSAEARQGNITVN